MAWANNKYVIKYIFSQWVIDFEWSDMWPMFETEKPLTIVGFIEHAEGKPTSLANPRSNFGNAL